MPRDPRCYDSNIRHFESLLRDLATGVDVNDKRDEWNDWSAMMLYCMSEELQFVDCEYPNPEDGHRKTYTLNEAGRELYRRVLGEDPPALEVEASPEA